MSLKEQRSFKRESSLHRKQQNVPVAHQMESESGMTTGPKAAEAF